MSIISARQQAQSKKRSFNTNRKQEEDTRTPEELLSLIEAQEKEVSSVLAALRSKGL